MSYSLPVTMFLLALGTTVAVATVRGSPLERLTALMLILATIASVVADAAVAGTFIQPEWGVALVDVLLLIYLLWVMKLSSRFWPIWAVGFHSISIMTHIAATFAPALRDGPYAVYSEWWGLFVVLALFAGTFEGGATAPNAISRSSRATAR